MLIPWLDGVLSFGKAPITWLMVFFCFTMYLLTNASVEKADQDLQEQMDDAHYMESQGYLFAQYILQNPQKYSELIQGLARGTAKGEMKHQDLLANLALRDPAFIANYLSVVAVDPVAELSFKNHFRSVAAIQEADPLYGLGVFSEQYGLKHLVSYIFMHSGFAHLFGNMFFLLIFGGMIERREGSLVVLMVFIGTGMVGALTFLLLTEPTYAPLVGASGAISGLMGYCCAVVGRQRVRYFFTLFLPQRKYYGFVYLPAYCILLMWICADLAGYLSSLRELGGIAYPAHLGGEMAGLLIGLSLNTVRSFQDQSFGANPLRSVFSVITRGSMNWSK
jgi:membrane associated rhomboid family serine protease